MKKTFLIALLLVLGIALTGCQSKNQSSNVDDAESALVEDSSASNIAAPPVPPVPTRPAQ
jgi:uncharacterized protein YcfL